MAELPVPERSADEARRLADEILGRPEFAEPPKSLFERFGDAISDLLGRLVAALLQGGTGSVVAWAFLATIVAVVVYLGIRFARRLQENPTHGGDSLDDRRRPPADWRADAEAHEARGEWKAALRARYRALVAELGARGLVDEVPGRTAGEYRAEVGDNLPAAVPDFDGASELFESAWYGNRDTGPEENRHFRSLADRVLSGTGS